MTSAKRSAALPCRPVFECSKSLCSFSNAERAKLFKLLLKEALDSRLEGMDEWGLSLLESAATAMSTPAERAKWTELLDKLSTSREHRRGSYAAERTAELKHGAILKFDGEDEAQNYLHSHLEITSFRKKAVEDAIKNNELESAMALILAGEEQSKHENHRGLLKEWKRGRYDLYRLTGQKDLQIQLAEEFVLSGERGYYEQLKELYGELAWPSAYERILNGLKEESQRAWQVQPLYIQMLIAEKESLRLLELIRSWPELLVNYYRHLVGEHAEEVYSLFEQIITKSAGQASNRKEYQKACGIITHLIKAGGKEQAREVIGKLQKAYPNRPALLDELQKFK